MSDQRPPHLLFVCLGNICRSPAAEGVARAMAVFQRLDWVIDSAGTGPWHVGSPPDQRMTTVAAKRGVELYDLTARQVQVDDFSRFDYVFAMDRNNLARLQEMRPPESRATLQLFLENAEVPDPYHGGPEGFDHVLDLIENRMQFLFETVRQA